MFPDAIVQTCIVHLLRNSMDFVSWKDRKGLATALKEVYRATDADTAEKALTAFEVGPCSTRRPPPDGYGYFNRPLLAAA